MQVCMGRRANPAAGAVSIQPLPGAQFSRLKTQLTGDFNEHQNHTLCERQFRGNTGLTRMFEGRLGAAAGPSLGK